MTERDDTFFDRQGQAVMDAHDALKIGSVDLLPTLIEQADQRTFNEAILMNALMISFQLSMVKQEVIKCLEDITESIDFAGARNSDFWMTSELAAIDKAKEIGLAVQRDWTIADLRYKLHQAIYGGEHG